MSNDNMALLAAASYANFEDINKIGDALREEISESQAKTFTDTYEVIAHQSNTSSGYSGTIVQNRHSGKYFVLHRGTEIGTTADWLEDGILSLTGLPYRQLMDAKAFVDENIRNGNIRGNFINVGHNLGKSISDLIHFTTDRSKGSIGFKLYH